MLKIGTVERQLLNASGALTTDGLGKEILAGLTVAESEFVLNAESCGDEQLAPDAREMYLRLRIRHRQARMVLAVKVLDSTTLRALPHKDGAI